MNDATGTDDGSGATTSARRQPVLLQCQISAMRNHVSLVSELEGFSGMYEPD